MTDPLGRSQVLPYLTGLAAKGHRITLLSLEKPPRFERTGGLIRQMCEEAGINWRPLPYRSSPPIVAGQWNVWRLGREAIKLHRRDQFDIVHARSDLASLAGSALWRRGGAKFLYDMRALWPDERVDGGSWPQRNPLYRYIFRRFKRHQLEFLNEASAIVSLTERGKALIEGWPSRTGSAQVTVIPCCSDYDFFRPATQGARTKAREAMAIPSDAKVLIYLGSIGSWYMLSEMLDFAAAYRRRHQSMRLLIVTPDDPKPILEAADKRGLGELTLVESATREEIPSYLAASDVGLFFIMPVFSKCVSSPTKLGEMLACGLPVVTNDGVGDVGEIVRAINAGVLVDAFSDAAYDTAIRDLEGMQPDAEKIRNQSRHWFDVEMGIGAYDRIYRNLKELVQSK